VSSQESGRTYDCVGSSLRSVKSKELFGCFVEIVISMLLTWFIFASYIYISLSVYSRPSMVVFVGAKLQANNRVPRPVDRGTATRYGG